MAWFQSPPFTGLVRFVWFTGHSPRPDPTCGPNSPGNVWSNGHTGWDNRGSSWSPSRAVSGEASLGSLTFAESFRAETAGFGGRFQCVSLFGPKPQMVNTKDSLFAYHSHQTRKLWASEPSKRTGISSTFENPCIMLPCLWQATRGA